MNNPLRKCVVAEE